MSGSKLGERMFVAVWSWRLIKLGGKGGEMRGRGNATGGKILDKYSAEEKKPPTKKGGKHV